ncbi:MAG: hypothetical protein E6G06_01020 [Actinobacteria bacterium]|nr:MAG: hypothetical protein E6G06_01020 [Actinomycetota bacterium]
MLLLVVALVVAGLGPRGPLARARAAASSSDPIGFGKSTLAGTKAQNPTSLQFGPDGRLYVAQYNGGLAAYTVSRKGPNDYVVTATERIGIVLVAGTASSPVIYVTSSDPRIGGGPFNIKTGLDTNSSMVSKLTKSAGKWQRLDLVRGLPRSEENHAANGVALDTVTNMLYVAQGGNTNMGAKSNNFGFLAEYAYSAAILKIDLNAIGNTTYDLPTLADDKYPNLQGPFGGDHGRHQARIVANSPVQVYAPGFRNPYDLLLTPARKLYTIDNGSNAGWGDVPINEGPGGTCTNGENEPGVTEHDSLHLVTGPGYYGGHPNPTRGNRANTFNGAHPQSPVLVANPIECDERGPGVNGSIATLPSSANGLTQYRASNFAGAMTGDLIVANFSGTVYRVRLNPTGDRVVAVSSLFANAGVDPLDVVAQGDLEPFPGTIWMADFNVSGPAGTIVVFEPNDYGGLVPPPCTGAYSTTLDEDHDGYKNADEIDNGTNPCSAADTPHDWDHDSVSDRNDPDDDNDGLPDTSDPFAIDAQNGRATSIPVSYTWDSGSPSPGGLLNLGWTGLMTNGQANYSTLFDPTHMTAGGSAGVMTVDQVPAGDAKGATNTQQYAFQFGIRADPASTGVFTVHTRLDAPFSGITPAGRDSMGVFIGTGDQDNYLKLVVGARDGGSVQCGAEVGGTPTLVAEGATTLPGPDAIDLYLTVDPATGAVQPSYALTSGGITGPRVDLGTGTSIPTAWLTNAGSGLAVGTIATSAGATPFPGTWDLFEVTAGA